MIRHANKEKWNQQREDAYNKSVELIQQKTASSTAENAVIAARIRAKLLRKLEKEIDALPDAIGSETRNSVVEKDNHAVKGKSVMKEVTKAYKLRDLTAAYRDLTEDMPKEEDSSTLEKLDRLLEVAWDVAHSETS